MPDRVFPASWVGQDIAALRHISHTSAFHFGAQVLFGSLFYSLVSFRFEDVKLPKDVVRIGIHLRHARSCFNGLEMVDAALHAALGVARGRPCLLLVASDRRAAIARLHELAGPC